MQPERLPLEVDARNMRVARFSRNLGMGLQYFTIRKLDVQIRLLNAPHEHYAFALALGACEQLTDLELRTQLTPGLMRALCRVGHLSRLTTLCLVPGSMLDEDTMTSFVRLCEELSSLTSLSMWHASFRNGDILALALQHLRRLTTLALHNVHMTATCLRNAVVPPAFDFRSTLTELHLGFSHEVKIWRRPDQDVAASMTEEVLDALLHFNALTLLQLSGLDTLGQSATLFRSLHVFSGLQALAMRGCEIDDDSVHHLAISLPGCTSLQQIDLAYNQIDLEGMTSLVQVLPQCTHLINLDISCSNVREFPVALRDIISASKTTVYYDNPTTPDYSPAAISDDNEAEEDA
jgi:hypothetical protein